MNTKAFRGFYIMALLLLISTYLWVKQTQLAERYQLRLTQLSAQPIRPLSTISQPETELKALLNALKIKGSVTRESKPDSSYNFILSDEPVAFSTINVLFQEFHMRNYHISACKLINADLQGSVHVQELIVRH